MVNSFNETRHRRSIRLKGHDYTSLCAYFVTVCAQNRKCLFGEVMSGIIQLNENGRVVHDEWLKSVDIRMEIQLGEFVIMPNHLHGIVYIVGNRRGDRPVALHLDPLPSGAPASGPQSKSIGAFMAGFKSTVTKRINQIRQSPGMPVWQRNYYEHIIRDDADYKRIAEYVAANPKRWREDTLNPDNPLQGN